MSQNKAHKNHKTATVLLGTNITEWMFCVYLRGCAFRDLRFLLIKNNSTRDNFYGKCVVKIKDFRKEIDVGSSENRKSKPYCFIVEDFFCPVYDYIQKDQTFRFFIKFQISEIDSGHPYKLINFEPENVSKLYESFGEFLNNENYSDFTLICSDRVSIPVHRLILAKKSQVFKNMFDIDMSEKKENTAKLGDINSNTMKALLRFVYTGVTEEYDVKLATSVLYAAEKYQIFQLKCHCISELIAQLKKDNVLEILRTAEMYDEHELEDKCLAVILVNYEELKETKKFKALKPSLLLKVIDAAYSETSHWTFETTFVEDQL